MKKEIITAVIDKLEQELNLRQTANARSNAGARFSAANADKQRDTTGFEAAHLARGYAIQHHSLSKQLDELKEMTIEDFSGQEIDIGAIAEVEMGGSSDLYMLLSCGGGTEVNIDGQTVTVITPESPLGSKLMGNFEAGLVTLPTGAEGIILDVF